MGRSGGRTAKVLDEVMAEIRRGGRPVIWCATEAERDRLRGLLTDRLDQTEERFRSDAEAVAADIVRWRG